MTGFFLNAIEFVLYCDYHKVVTVDEMANTILVHLAANADHYKRFHMGHVVRDTESYFMLGSYYESIVDRNIIATSYTLLLNLPIYEKGPDGYIQVVQQKSHSRVTDVHLKFMHKNLLHNHYDTILPNAKSGQLSFLVRSRLCDEGEDDVRHIPASDTGNTAKT